MERDTTNNQNDFFVTRTNSLIVGLDEPQDLTGSITIVVKKKELKTHGLWFQLTANIRYSARDYHYEITINQSLLEYTVCFDPNSKNLSATLTDRPTGQGVIKCSYANRNSIIPVLTKGKHTIPFKLTIPSTVDWNESLSSSQHDSFQKWHTLSLAYKLSFTLVRSFPRSNLKYEDVLLASHATKIGRKGYQIIASPAPVSADNKVKFLNGEKFCMVALDKTVYSTEDDMEITLKVDDETAMGTVCFEFQQEFYLDQHQATNEIGATYLESIKAGEINTYIVPLRDILRDDYSRFPEKYLRSMMIVVCRFDKNSHPVKIQFQVYPPKSFLPVDKKKNKEKIQEQ